MTDRHGRREYELDHPGADLRWWDGTQEGQAEIVSWSGGQVEGFFGDPSTDDGSGPDATYFLRLPSGDRILPGDGIERTADGFEAIHMGTCPTVPPLPTRPNGIPLAAVAMLVCAAFLLGLALGLVV